MSCADIEPRVALYAGGDLDEESGRHLEQHLTTCETCRDLLTALRVQREAMAASWAVALTQDDLDDVRNGVLAAIARGDARRRTLNRLRFAPFRSVAWGAAGLAAAAMLVFAVGMTISRPQDLAPARGAAGPPNRAVAQTAAVPAPRTLGAVPAQAGRTTDARSEPTAESTRFTAAAGRPSAMRQRLKPTEMGTAGVSLASGSRGIVAEDRNAVEIFGAPAGPMRRIEFQTADPNIRIIWLLPEVAPDPNRSGSGAR